MGVRAAETRRSPAVIELHIDELVLHGFNSSDRFRIGDAMERELHRLMAGKALPVLFASHASIERLDAGQFMVAPGARPQSIGAQLAQSVHQRLSVRGKHAARVHTREGRKTQ